MGRGETLQNANGAFTSRAVHIRYGRDLRLPDGGRFDVPSRNRQSSCKSSVAYAVANFHPRIDGPWWSAWIHEVSGPNEFGDQCSALRVCVRHASSLGDHDPPFIWPTGEADFYWKDVSRSEGWSCDRALGGHRPTFWADHRLLGRCLSVTDGLGDESVRTELYHIDLWTGGIAATGLL